MSTAPTPANAAATPSGTPASGAGPATSTTPAKAKKDAPPESARDTIESIIFALLMAFLFRTFEAEAFVIPTGSMAPTLYGRHKELHCHECGYPIVVGASDEVDNKDGSLINRLNQVVCQNCGGVTDAYEDVPFNGDRILVNKYPYEFGEPDRWDVFVFKNPEQPEMNYIKRLVGLPGETIRIRNGDLYGVVDGKASILRKPPEKQRLLQIPVYDDRYPAEKLLAAGWPERWAAVEKTGQPNGNGAIDGWEPTDLGWKHDPKTREFRLEKADAAPRTIRYRHYLATPEVWQSLASGIDVRPAASLVADDCGYNNFTVRAPFNDGISPSNLELGAYWVNDLTVNFGLELTAIDPGAAVVLELLEGVYQYQCKIDPSSGMATLTETSMTGNVTVELASQQTSLRGPGTYAIAFTCVDDRLCLWIDGSLVDFGPKASLEHFATADSLPHPRDRSPVGITVAGAQATVRELLLQRDVYYRTAESHCLHGLEDQLARLLDNVEQWSELYSNTEKCQTRDLQVDRNGFLAFGDNSPRSSDSRFWRDTQSVPRDFLVGKAFWIYWPHGVPFLNGGKGFTVMKHAVDRDVIKDKSWLAYPKMTFPFYPQFWRMKRIR